MSCEKLYLTAPEMLECTARVVSCTPNKNDGYDLETDRTPFFPEGGGQLSDIGTVYDPMQGRSRTALKRTARCCTAQESRLRWAKSSRSKWMPQSV